MVGGRAVRLLAGGSVVPVRAARSHQPDAGRRRRHDGRQVPGHRSAVGSGRALSRGHPRGMSAGARVDKNRPGKTVFTTELYSGCFVQS